MVNTTDNIKYAIENTSHHVVPNIPYEFRFYVKFNPKQKPPQLTKILLNGRPICPEKQLQPSIITKNTNTNNLFADKVNERFQAVATGKLGEKNWNNGVSLISTIDFDEENEDIDRTDNDNADHFPSDFTNFQTFSSKFKSNALSVSSSDSVCGEIVVSINYIHYSIKHSEQALQ